MVNPENTFFSVKRFIGRKMNEVKEESKQIPYQVRSSMHLNTHCTHTPRCWCTNARASRCLLPCTSGACPLPLAAACHARVTVPLASGCCLPQIVDESSSVKIKSSNAGKNFAPEEISALVLRKLTDDAAKFLNDKVDKAVITVPAYFNDSQRQVRARWCRLGATYW